MEVSPNYDFPLDIHIWWGGSRRWQTWAGGALGEGGGAMARAGFLGAFKLFFSKLSLVSRGVAGLPWAIFRPSWMGGEDKQESESFIIQLFFCLYIIVSAWYGLKPKVLANKCCKIYKLLIAVRDLFWEISWEELQIYEWGSLLDFAPTLKRRSVWWEKQ